MQRLKIDPEFRDKIPSLTEAEFEQLRENILSDGEVYEPIVTWNDTIVDGHNRWKIICENWELLKDKFRTKQMDFADKWEAFDWMYRKQLGRRNLSDENRTYIIGKMYEVRKKTSGGQAGNNNAIKRDAQIGQLVSTSDKEKHGVSGEIALELNVGRNTVRRAEKFAKGVDALREQSVEAAEKVLLGGSGITKGAVAEIADMTKQEVAEVAKDIVTGEIKKKNREVNRTTKETRDRYNTISEIAHKMGNEEVETTFDDVLRLLNIIEDDFLTKLERTIDNEREKLSADERWPNAIEGYFDSVIADITELKRRIVK